jgi:hypothetical protein
MQFSVELEVDDVGSPPSFRQQWCTLAHSPLQAAILFLGEFSCRDFEQLRCN